MASTPPIESIPQPCSSPANGEPTATAPDETQDVVNDLAPPTPDDTLKRVAPPYWTAHQRSISNVSYCSIQNTRHRRVPIALQDNTVEGTYAAETNNVVWAKHVTIEDYTIVSATPATTKFGDWALPGSYVAWNITITTLEGGPIKVIKRYSEFDELRQRLMLTFPLSEGAMPPLPPKSYVSKFRAKFLEKRREGLSYFLNCILLNPEFAGSRVLKDWVFGE